MTQRISTGRPAGPPLKPLIYTILASGVALLAGCTMPGAEGAPSALNPQGYGAQAIAELWWLMFWLGLLVFLAVLALAGYAALRRRRPPDEARELRFGHRLAIIGGIVMPVIVLGIVLFATVSTMSRLAALAAPAPVIVEVIGYQFWWEVRYPGYNFTTANEIHIPVGQPVEVRLTSGDVIHSFWAPELDGKMDLVPGQVNSFTIQVDTPGVYRGFCAEFCGIQHTLMQFLVIAQEPATFAAWAEQQQRPARLPDTELLLAGQAVFLAECAYCHAIRGVNEGLPVGVAGPDLTHLAGRRTIAAGVLENNTGNLGGWVLNPQAIKPGNHMPAVPLESEEFQALLAYLASLE